MFLKLILVLLSTSLFGSTNEPRFGFYSEVNSGAIGTGADSAVKIVGLSGDPENNDTTYNNPNIIVKINKHLYSANTAGI